MNQSLTLSGLDGSNPLAFLAALGTLRGLTRAWPDQTVHMAWTVNAGWRPQVHLQDVDPQNVMAALWNRLQDTRGDATLEMADNLTIPADEYRTHLRRQLTGHNAHCDESTAFAAAFGCDAIRDEKGNIVDTALRTMSGAGHQHFLKTMRVVLAKTTKEHIEQALFRPWRYCDPLRNLSLRLDPSDDKRYALRWDNPSDDPTREIQGSVLGANALAVLGIPLLVTAPVRGRLETTGFKGSTARDTFWTWPIWEHPASLDVVRSLLALKELQEERPRRALLCAIGIGEVFRSCRLTVGKFRNFTPAQPV